LPVRRAAAFSGGARRLAHEAGHRAVAAEEAEVNLTDAIEGSRREAALTVCGHAPFYRRGDGMTSDIHQSKDDSAEVGVKGA
jgi:hypothetical protein